MQLKTTLFVLFL